MFDLSSAIKITSVYGVELKGKSDPEWLYDSKGNVCLDGFKCSFDVAFNAFNSDLSLYHLIDNGSTINEKFHLGLETKEFVVVDTCGNVYEIRFSTVKNQYFISKKKPFNVQKDYDSDYVRMKVTLFRRIVTVSRLVACCFPEYCGRDVTGKYDAHHINMDSTNNDVSNIVFLDKKTHKRLHKAFNRMDEVEKQEAIDALITEDGAYDYRMRIINSIIRTYGCRR